MQLLEHPAEPKLDRQLGQHLLQGLQALPMFELRRRIMSSLLLLGHPVEPIDQRGGGLATSKSVQAAERDDLIQPCFQGRGVAQRRQLAPRGQQRFLNDVLGQVTVPHGAYGVAKQRCLVDVDQHLEGVEVAVLGARHQGCLVEVGQTGPLGGQETPFHRSMVTLL